MANTLVLWMFGEDRIRTLESEVGTLMLLLRAERPSLTDWLATSQKRRNLWRNGCRYCLCICEKGPDVLES
jgi:hypothetical protein